MKISNSKNKFVYLISPNKITSYFYRDLIKIFKSYKINFFQLRLKKKSYKSKILIAKKIQKLCRLYKIKFIINDDPHLAKKVNADGCHLGQKDINIKKARKILGNKIIGIPCHNSIRLAKAAVKNKASYIAFGAFFSTKTKKVKFKASTRILNKVKKLTKTPIVAIGGINFDNYKKLLLNNSNLLAISGYIWNNKKYKPLESIEKIK